MYDITVISMIVACIVSLVKKNGGIAYILEKIHSHIRGRKGAQFGVAGLSFLVDMATANNTIAIVMAGPIAREISDDFGVSPKRTASILDIFTSAAQGLIPYGAQILLAAGQTGLSPMAIIPYVFYPILMLVCVLALMMVRKDQ